MCMKLLLRTRPVISNFGFSLTLRCQIEMLTEVSSCTRNSAFSRVARVAHLAESNEQLKVGKDRKKGSKIKNSFQQQFAYWMPYLTVLYV